MIGDSTQECSANLQSDVNEIKDNSEEAASFTPVDRESNVDVPSSKVRDSAALMQLLRRRIAKLQRRIDLHSFMSIDAFQRAFTNLLPCAELCPVSVRGFIEKLHLKFVELGVQHLQNHSTQPKILQKHRIWAKENDLTQSRDSDSALLGSSATSALPVLESGPVSVAPFVAKPRKRKNPSLEGQPTCGIGYWGAQTWSAGHGITQNGPLPSAPSQKVSMETLKLDQATRFCESVRITFKDKPDIYHRFLELVKMNPANAQAMRAMVDEVRKLLINFPALLQEFAVFVGPEYAHTPIAPPPAQTNPANLQGNGQKFTQPGYGGTPNSAQSASGTSTPGYKAKASVGPATSFPVSSATVSKYPLALSQPSSARPPLLSPQQHVSEQRPHSSAQSSTLLLKADALAGGQSSAGLQQSSRYDHAGAYSVNGLAHGPAAQAAIGALLKVQPTNQVPLLLAASSGNKMAQYCSTSSSISPSTLNEAGRVTSAQLTSAQQRAGVSGQLGVATPQRAGSVGDVHRAWPVSSTSASLDAAFGGIGGVGSGGGIGRVGSGSAGGDNAWRSSYASPAMQDTRVHVANQAYVQAAGSFHALAGVNGAGAVGNGTRAAPSAYISAAASGSSSASPAGTILWAHQLGLTAQQAAANTAMHMQSGGPARCLPQTDGGDFDGGGGPMEAAEFEYRSPSSLQTHALAAVSGLQTDSREFAAALLASKPSAAGSRLTLTSPAGHSGAPMQAWHKSAPVPMPRSVSSPMQAAVTWNSSRPQAGFVANSGRPGSFTAPARPSGAVGNGPANAPEDSEEEVDFAEKRDEKSGEFKRIRIKVNDDDGGFRRCEFSFFIPFKTKVGSVRGADAPGAQQRLMQRIRARQAALYAQKTFCEDLLCEVSRADDRRDRSVRKRQAKRTDGWDTRELGRLVEQRAVAAGVLVLRGGRLEVASSGSELAGSGLGGHKDESVSGRVIGGGADGLLPAWVDTRACGLCGIVGDRAVLGRLLFVELGMWAHVGCLCWSAEVYEDTQERRLGKCGMLCRVHDCIAAAQSVVCDFCGCVGASVRCSGRGCFGSWHFGCAVMAEHAFLRDNWALCQRCRGDAGTLEACGGSERLLTPAHMNKMWARHLRVMPRSRPRIRKLLLHVRSPTVALKRRRLSASPLCIASRSDGIVSFTLELKKK